MYQIIFDKKQRSFGRFFIKKAEDLVKQPPVLPNDVWVKIAANAPRIWRALVVAVPQISRWGLYKKWSTSMMESSGWRVLDFVGARDDNNEKIRSRMILKSSDPKYLLQSPDTATPAVVYTEGDGLVNEMRIHFSGGMVKSNNHQPAIWATWENMCVRIQVANNIIVNGAWNKPAVVVSRRMPQGDLVKYGIWLDPWNKVVIVRRGRPDVVYTGPAVRLLIGALGWGISFTRDAFVLTGYLRGHVESGASLIEISKARGNMAEHDPLSMQKYLYNRMRKLLEEFTDKIVSKE